MNNKKAIQKRPRLSIKAQIKKQISTANKNYNYKKLKEQFDLIEEMNKLMQENYDKKFEKMQQEFNNSKDYDLLYPIIKLSNPNLEKSNKIVREPLISRIFENIKKKIVFFYFFSFYHINDNLIKKLIPFLEYEIFEKDSYIYKENELSTKIYFIIKGNISFRKREIPLDENDINSSFEETEKFTLGENKYFGEIDLAYDRRKKYSAYCTTDCHIITIKKENFKKLIEDKVSRVETDKKYFLISIFNNYTNMPNIKLERFLANNVHTLFFRRNDIIFKEGDDNISLYIIYCGEAILIKNIKKGEFSYITKFNESIKYIIKKASKLNYCEIINNFPINKEEEKNNEINLELSLNRIRYNIIGKMTKNSIGGLEITTGIKKLRYSLISNSDFTCVLKVDLKSIDDYLKTLMLNLLPMFIKLEKLINKQINNLKLIDETILPNSCKKLKKNFSDPNYVKDDEEEETDKFYKRHIQKIQDNFQLNKGGFIKNNEYNFNLYQQKIYFEKMLIRNHKKNYEIKKFLKQLEQEEKSNLKYTEFKMNNLVLNSKENQNQKYFCEPKLKRPESCFFSFNNTKGNKLKFGNLKLNEIELNNNDELCLSNNYLTKNNLFKINKRTLNVIKNVNNKKRKLIWNNFEDKLKYKKKENIKNNNNDFFSIINNSSKNKDNKKNYRNKLSYIKHSLSIDDDNYIKNVLIYKSPRKENKFKEKEIICSMPNNIKTINVIGYNEKNIETKSIINSYNSNKNLNIKPKKKKIAKKLLFYNTGKFDIPLLSNVS